MSSVKKNNSFNLLLVDDDKEFNNSLKRHLENLHHTCTQAFDIESSKEIINNTKSKIELVILCIDMEDENCELFKKELLAKENLKVILIAQNDSIAVRENSFKDGILDFYLKENMVSYIADDIHDSMLSLSQNTKETILIIDNSQEVCSSLKTILQNRNYNVLTALSGQEGIEHIRNNPISLLILDMELCDINGIDILVGLRDLYLINEFPILALSRSSNPSISRQALKKGSSDLITKPIRYEEFLLKVDKWIQTSTWQRTLKKQKLEIENSLGSFEALVNSTMEALFIFEKNICIDTNDEAVKLMGVTNKNQILGKYIFDIFTNVTQEHKKELLDEKKEHFFEDILYNSNNDILNIQIKEKNVQLKNKHIKIIAVMDITKIKHNEAILAHHTKMASMGEMMSNIAHQWRQPLTAISVSAGGIKLSYDLGVDDLDDTFKELDTIVLSTQFLSKTIDDFQNFLKDTRVNETFLLENTIEKSLTIIKGNLESSSIQIVKDKVDNIRINAIENDLIQVLLNIINNSVDALKNKVDETDRIIHIQTTTDQDNIIITIQDSAQGISDDIINKIFEPYFTTKHQSRGTGLGLYMTHQIIEKLGGKITVENKEFIIDDRNYFGATFNIYLPKN